MENRYDLCYFFLFDINIIQLTSTFFKLFIMTSKINLSTYNDINDVEYDCNTPAIAYSISIIIIIVF